MFFDKKSSSQSVNQGISHSEKSGGNNTRILAILAQDYLKEKKSRHRWGMFLKLLVLGYVVFVSIAYFKFGDKKAFGEHTAIVELNGTIGSDAVSARQINQSLGNAFEAKNSVGVVLRINSPGGTPVQAAQINEEIDRLKALYPEKPIYVAVTDICASGGYYIAVAADEIFAHPSSIVGSIGVLMNGFGFVKSMNKLGVERRLITAGKNKGILDPFSPINPQHQAHAKKILDEVHQQFIDAVKKGRGDRLNDNPEIFSGLFWSGSRARQLGLIDQFGSAEQIARDVIGAEKIVDYSYQPKFLDIFAEQVGASISNTFLKQFMTLE